MAYPQHTSSLLSRYLYQNSVPKGGGSFTHLSLGKPGGTFYIDAKKEKTFLEYYKQALDNKEDLYIAESNRPIGPVKVDFDFVFEPAEDQKKEGEEEKEDKDDKDKTTYPKALKPEIIREIVEVYIDTFKDLFEVPEDGMEMLTAYVMEKKGPITYTTDKKVKEGLHIMFPFLVCKPTVQYLGRSLVLPKLAPILERIGCIAPADKVVDAAVIEINSWLMYGSKKFNREPYLLTKTFTPVVTKPKKAHSEGEEDIIELKMTKVNRNIPNPSQYVDILSIRNKYDETRINVKWINEILKYDMEQEARNRKMNLTKLMQGERPNTNKNVSCDMDNALVEKLVKILKVERVENYDSWMRLGWCLRNIDYRNLHIWEEASKKSTKYIEGECAQKWLNMRNSGLNIGTLHMWAKEDDLDKYKEIMQNDLHTLMKMSLSKTHTDIARVVFFKYRHRFVCASMSSRRKTWYEFKDHRWNYNGEGESLKPLISGEISDEYSKLSSQWSRRAIDQSDEDEKTRCQETAKKFLEISMKLRNVPFKASIFSECQSMFFDPTFESKLNENDNLICFNNGVYDLSTEEFRDGRPDDYCSFSTQIDYVEYNPMHPHVESIRHYLSQVFPKSDVREFVITLLSTFLSGSIRNQKFDIWTGSGCNSKSVLVEFFMKCFGDYTCIFPVTLLTMKRKASNEACSEVAMAKGKRFALMSEPSEDEKLNVGYMKELTGGDKIMARQLFHDPITFKPKFKIVLCCNNLPKVPSDDGGTWRRIRVANFTSKFVTNPNPNNPNEFAIDLDLPRRMEEWCPHFMAMLIQYYKKYKVNGLEEPHDVTECTREYQRSNDHMAEFLHSRVEPRNGTFLPLNEVFQELKSYVASEEAQIKIPTKSELDKYMCRVLNTKSTIQQNVKGYVNFRIKVDGPSSDTEEINA